MATFILESELCIINSNLQGYEDNIGITGTDSELGDVGTLLDAVLKGQFESVLLHEIGQRVLRTEKEEADITELEKVIGNNVEAFVKETDGEEKLKKQLCILCVAVSGLQLFVQNNWVGPLTKRDLLDVLPTQLNTQGATFQEQLHSALQVDGEAVYPLATHLGWLFLARTILLNCRDSLKDLQSCDWWLMRCLQTQQSILDERSPTLKASINQLIEDLQKTALMTGEQNRNAAMQFHLEAGHLCYFYYEPSKATEHFNQAKKLSGLNVELTGALGKRTRFQQDDFSQLVLKVERLALSGDDQMESSNNSELVPTGAPTGSTDSNHVAGMAQLLPKNVSLDDETVMNKIELSDPGHQYMVPLTPTEQALIIGLCAYHRRNHEGQGKIVEEECLAFVTAMLSQPQSWCVESTALLQRTRWEQDSPRRLQRSMAQFEELVNQSRRAEPPAHTRLPLLYSVQIPPRWTIEKELGSMFTKIGATNAALEVYERLQMWEEVIRCYQSLGRTAHAEKLIREQLVVKETANLWCYLGDVTHVEEHYQTAWELSNGRSARAMKAMGYHYIAHQQHEKSLPCFEKSLQVNALQVGVWFSYGCAALFCKQYELAAKAFRRCVTLDGDNFEAWNNLATAYIRSNQKSRAFVALQEALKCDYENWRIWENYLLVAVDIGQFDDCIRACHRMLEKKKKWADSEVLGILVKAVNEDLKDASGEPTAKLRPKLTELFGRVTAVVTTDAEVWRLYAELLMGAEEVTQTDRERAVQFLQKSHRCNTQTYNWEKDLTKCKDITEKSQKLFTTYLQVTEKIENETQVVQLLSSARLSLKGMLTKIKQHHTDPLSKQLAEDLAEPCNRLEEILQLTIDTITQKQS